MAEAVDVGLLECDVDIVVDDDSDAVAEVADDDDNGKENGLLALTLTAS